MENHHIRRSLEVMNNARAAILTTIDPEGYPISRAMLNLRRPGEYPGLADFFREIDHRLGVYFTTNTSSSKIAHIRDNPKAAVYYCLPNEYRGVMLGGIIEIVDDPKLKKLLWQTGWELYYPSGSDDPDYTILRLLPEFARGYHQLTFYNIDFRNRQ